MKPTLTRFAFILSSFLIISSSFNPPDLYTGNPSENGGATCSTNGGCHGGGSYISSMALMGIPGSQVLINTMYNLSLDGIPVGSPSPIRVGFQMEAVNGANTTHIGTFSNAGPNVVITPSGSKTLVEHQPVKDAVDSGDPINYTVTWKAPPTVGDGTVKFYTVMNNCNVDGGSGGDNATKVTFTYTIVASSPVEWLKVEIKTNNKQKPIVHWTTASESNNDYFEIQRSSEGTTWTSLGRVNGNGESNEIRNYQFTDAEPMNTYTLYRVVQVDRDQQKGYSRIVAWEPKKENPATLSPNPAVNQVTLTLPENSQNIDNVTLMDHLGKKIKTIKGQQGQSGILEISLEDISPGHYLVRCGTTTLPLMKL